MSWMGPIWRFWGVLASRRRVVLPLQPNHTPPVSSRAGRRALTSPPAACLRASAGVFGVVRSGVRFETTTRRPLVCVGMLCVLQRWVQPEVTKPAAAAPVGPLLTPRPDRCRQSPAGGGAAGASGTADRFRSAASAGPSYAPPPRSCPSRQRRRAPSRPGWSPCR